MLSSSSILNLALMSIAIKLSLARNTGPEVTFDEYYKITTETYGALDVGDYILPPRWQELMVIREGTQIDVQLNTAAEKTRQTHASACADACTSNQGCFAFLVGYNDLTDKECQLLSDGNLYVLEGRDEQFSRPQIEENFKQLYFKKESPCGEGQSVTYEVKNYEGFKYDDLGCKDLIQDGDICDFEDKTYKNAHEDRICAEGRDCVSMYGILDTKSYLNGWHDMMKSCESPETIANAHKEVAVHNERQANLKSDMASGVYDELIHGNYTVSNYKTLRSKLGDTVFTYFYGLRHKTLQPVLSLTGEDSYSTADAYAVQCAKACDTQTGCMGFSIVWQLENPVVNVCYLVVGDETLRQYDANVERETSFVGQVFVPKQYMECAEGEVLAILYSGSISFRGCSTQTYDDPCYDATNGVYGGC